MTTLTQIIHKLFGNPQLRRLRPYYSIVETINSHEKEISALSDEQLKAKTTEFRLRLSTGATLDELLPEAFAVVREAAKRVLNMRPFDVQLIGGVVLHEGKIAEMKTGEGKTLVCTMPAYLNALEGKGVYVVTVNDYLARRDKEWMGKVYEFLGLSVGLIQAGMRPDERKKAYDCDITYGTNNEYGFDYLRDNLAWDLSQCVQTRRHYAIIDEVDSILIDEARTPLIISGTVQDSTEKYKQVARVVKRLQKDTHFTLDEKHKNVVLTEEGTEKIEADMGLDNMYTVQNMDIAHMAVQCLKAMHLFRRDVDYVVKDGEVLIVDEFTGRILEGRRYSDGLHQAIEAVENLSIREESQTLASITFQNYFRMFPKLAGMTGTAATEAMEFVTIYGLNVEVIPTHKVMIRQDMSDLVYKTKDEKYKAIVKQIRELHEKGQPVLVGTIAIETSELLSAMLKREGISHSVLNAKHHEKEAEIIARAGQKGAVTIATNMAGRGTDIVLGEGVKDLGGLFVLGTERHESRRIDNQLRGRSGRQGDPGASRFYVALNDDLMRLFGSDRIARIMDTLGLPADTPIEHPLISRSIEKAQVKVERYYYGVRKQILRYDDVINKQRETIYALRHRILAFDKMDEKIKEIITSVVKAQFESVFEGNSFSPDEKERETFIEQVHHIFPLADIKAGLKDVKTKDDAIRTLSDAFYNFYLSRRSKYPAGLFDRVVTKRVLLLTLDRKWMDHLHNMDVLREGIGLRAYGQRDPLIEYKREAYDMFSDLVIGIYEEALEMINKSEILDAEQAKAIKPVAEINSLQTNRAEPTIRPLPASFQTEEENSSSAPDKPGRNDPCPCGSGRKYKKCCMNSEQS